LLVIVILKVPLCDYAIYGGLKLAKASWGYVAKLTDLDLAAHSHMHHMAHQHG
jgi:hypothetical protein